MAHLTDDAAPGSDGDEPPGPRPPRDWLPWFGIAALLGGLALALVGGAAVTLVGAALGDDLENGLAPGSALASTLVLDLALVAAALLLARSAAPTAAGQFGLRSLPFGVAVRWMLAAYGIYLLFQLAWTRIVTLEPPNDQLNALGVDENAVLLVGALLLVCVVAPVVEEFFFRGFLFGALRNWRGFWPAALICGALFGAIHVGGSPVEALLPLAVLGFALCLIYEHTGSIYPCIALHAVNNAIAFGITQDWGAGTLGVVAGALAACAVLVGAITPRWRGAPASV